MARLARPDRWAQFRDRCRCTGYTFRESIANIVTHALGLLLALIGAPLLVMLADRVGRAEHVIACLIYGVSLIAVFAASTSFHCRHGHPSDRFWLVLDHICIALLIAGTTTAMGVLAVKGDERWWLLGVTWLLAAAAIGIKVIWGLRFERLAMWFYAAMGWGAALTLPFLVTRLPGDSLAYIVGGSASYTMGLLYYARVGCGRVPYSHAIWHVMVVVGSGMFYFAVREFLLAAPR